MARARRFDNATPLELLDTCESVLEKSKAASGKLFMALFNTEFLEGRSIESSLKNWRQYYESTYGTKFYKYIVTKGEQKIKTDFNIEDTPTLIFIRDGAEISRIDDLDETNPAVAADTKEGELTKDEQRVKEKLDQLSKKE